MNYETTAEIEVAMALHLDWRRNIIVPNISWGAGVHECDLFVVTKSGWATEIEIKVSASDLKKGALKRHGHRSEKIQKLYFAIPKKLLRQWRFIPKHAGVYVVDQKGGVHRLREAEKQKQSRALTDKEVANIARLGTMRFWSTAKSGPQQKIEIARLKKMLKPDHQKQVFNIKFYRDELKKVLQSPHAQYTDRERSWFRRYYRDKLMEAVESLK